jgi:hypothetical protein
MARLTKREKDGTMNTRTGRKRRMAARRRHNIRLNKRFRITIHVIDNVSKAALRLAKSFESVGTAFKGLSALASSLTTPSI